MFRSLEEELAAIKSAEDYLDGLPDATYTHVVVMDFGDIWPGTTYKWLVTAFEVPMGAIGREFSALSTGVDGSPTARSLGLTPVSLQYFKLDKPYITKGRTACLTWDHLPSADKDAIELVIKYK